MTFLPIAFDGDLVFQSGYDDLSRANPGLIMVRISGYGQTGPYSRRPGYGITLAKHRALAANHYAWGADGVGTFNMYVAPMAWLQQALPILARRTVPERFGYVANPLP